MKIKKKFFVLFPFIICSFGLSAQNIEKGKASYYGKRFNNRKTASGIIYKKDDLVCAHKTYPFGTKLLVRNCQNDSTVIVEVIDRGPHKESRVIDISYMAAKKLNIIHHGIATVEVSEYIEDSIKSPNTVLTDSVKTYQSDSINLMKSRNIDTNSVL